MEAARGKLEWGEKACSAPKHATAGCIVWTPKNTMYVVSNMRQTDVSVLDDDQSMKHRGSPS